MYPKEAQLNIKALPGHYINQVLVGVLGVQQYTHISVIISIETVLRSSTWLDFWRTVREGGRDKGRDDDGKRSDFHRNVMRRGEERERKIRERG